MANHFLKIKWIDLIIGAIKQRFNLFIDARIPARKKVTLTHKTIYILPSKYGLIMIGVIISMLLAGINYANSVLLALGYWIMSFFIVAIIYTYRNLAGITVETAHVENGFAGESILLTLNVSRSGKRTYEAITLQHNNVSERVTLIDCQEAVAKLYIPVATRGYFRPDRIRLETTFPVGLFVCWAYTRFDIDGWVYPKPEKVALPSKAQGMGDEVDEQRFGGSEDFAGVQAYKVGDSLKHVDWKAFAREGKLYTKIFVDAASDEVWIDWQAFNRGDDIEQSYRQMCYWVLRLAEQDALFGLRLPYVEIEMGKGHHHKIRCLLALAQA